MTALMLGGAAFAADKTQQGQMHGQTQQGQMQQGQMQQGQKELTGRVVGVKSDDLLVESEQGAIIPLRVSHQTMVDGKELKKDQRIESHLKKEFQPGAEVRASFGIEKMENKAVSIEHKK
ncbi:hypothetical protein DB31_6015 [Hyalangium minutum]|uniref:DUF5666 domain-containing protein n=1 Tax=Hyalangium minutum TaxID=394096 RepID=A0A085VXI1_9BACT|nr:hypothetical protein DB31_6015 [Hyalangium minutum]